MAKKLTFRKLVSALKESGINRGDSLMVQGSLAPIGPVDLESFSSNSSDILEFYYSAFKEVLGENGTLFVHTPFEDYGRYGTPYIVEESPSRAGSFSEYLRTRPKAIRSMHPILSVCGIGPLAEEICGGPHFEGNGYESPWRRMYDHDVKMIAIGMSVKTIFSFHHYIEASYGVPYNYIKFFDTPVIKNGKQIEEIFSCTVRYLDFSIAYDLTRYVEVLFRERAAFEYSIGRSIFQLINYRKAFKIGMDCLNKDRYFFLKEPPKFRRGEYPYDGATGESKYSYDRAAKR